MKNIFAFFVCLMIVTGAAINCYKSVFGHELAEKKTGAPAVGQSTASGPSDNEAVVIDTSELSDAVGYAGKTPLKVTIENDVITSIEVLPNVETPGFFKRAQVILSQYEGKTVAEALSLDVDGVTGATLSSDALKDNVRAALTQYSGETADASQPEAASFPLKMNVALAVTLCAAIIPLFVRNKVYHIVQLILNVVVLGFWSGMFISYARIVGYLGAGTTLAAGCVVLLMMAVAFVYPLFGRKQHFCTHICPLGSIQQLAGLCCRKKIRMSAASIRYLNLFRQILWAALTFVLWLPVLFEWMDYELFSAFIVVSASPVVLVCAALFVVLSLFVPRPYCRFVCPTGTLMKVQENLFDK